MKGKLRVVKSKVNLKFAFTVFLNIYWLVRMMYVIYNIWDAIQNIL